MNPRPFPTFGFTSARARPLRLAAALGIGKVRESTNFPGAPITIVLGTDYAELVQ